MRLRVGTTIAATVAALGLIACGGGGGESDDGGGGGGGDDREASGPTSTTEPAADAPADSFALASVCGTGRGFRDLPAYEEGPGLHPIALFNGDEDDVDSWLYASFELPEGWGPDLAFADDEDLAEIELVGCVSETGTDPTGTDCEFDDDGDSITLELTDATYDVRVVEAATGDEVDTLTVEATEDGECPFFVSFQEGDTQYVSHPSDDQIVATLTDLVEP